MTWLHQKINNLVADSDEILAQLFRYNSTLLRHHGVLHKTILSSLRNNLCTVMRHSLGLGGLSARESRCLDFQFLTTEFELAK
jgi:hypothetical protein